MKYIVEVKYTNPGHEHVSLRRRVDTVTRLVEASNEQEALNRATNQQRALGFMIKEAKVVTPSIKPVQLSEGFDTDPKDIAAYLVNRHGKGKVTMDHIEAYERGRDSHRPIEKHEVMKHVKKMSEEVEQIDELKKSTLASYVNKAAHQVRAKSGIAASFETQGERKRDPENKSAYMDLAKDYRKGAKKRLTGIEKATSKLAKEEVGADKRDAGYKMSPAVRAAQAKSDELSKRKKKPQAGTLAAAKERGKVAAQKTDADVKVNVAKQVVAERVVNKKVAPDVPTPGQQKKVKAAKIAIGAARSKINLKPMV